MSSKVLNSTRRVSVIKKRMCNCFLVVFCLDIKRKDYITSTFYLASIACEYVRQEYPALNIKKKESLQKKGLFLHLSAIRTGTSYILKYSASSRVAAVSLGCEMCNHPFLSISRNA